MLPPAIPAGADARRVTLAALAVPALALAAVLVAHHALMRSAWLQGSGDAWSTGLTRTLESLAWLAAIVLVVRLIDAVLWERLLPRAAGMRLPRLLRQFFDAILILLGVTLMLSQVWQLAVAAILATTGVIGLVMGLALRRILADFFCGIALNVEQPFRLDDFVLLRTRGRREPIAGLVREINWRSTRILTPEDNLVSVPNSVVASSVVENLSFPSPVSEQEIDIALDWHVGSAEVEAVLGAAATEAWALGAAAGDKPPKVRICRLDGAGVTYRIVYLLDPRRKPKGPARHAMLACVQRHLSFAGLRPVPDLRQGAAHWPPPQCVADHRAAAARAALLARTELFAVLTESERLRLAEAAVVARIGAREFVVRCGDAGRSIFVVAAGVVEVRVPTAEGLARRAGVLGPGSLFGEMSLLTGAQRSADVLGLANSSVLYEIDDRALAPLQADRPELADALSAVVAAHQRDDAAAAAPSPMAGEDQRAPSPAAALAARIRKFFAPSAAAVPIVRG